MPKEEYDQLVKNLQEKKKDLSKSVEMKADKYRLLELDNTNPEASKKMNMIDRYRTNCDETDKKMREFNKAKEFFDKNSEKDKQKISLTERTNSLTNYRKDSYPHKVVNDDYEKVVKNSSNLKKIEDLKNRYFNNKVFPKQKSSLHQKDLGATTGNVDKNLVEEEKFCGPIAGEELFGTEDNTSEAQKKIIVKFSRKQSTKENQAMHPTSIPKISITENDKNSPTEIPQNMPTHKNL